MAVNPFHNYQPYIAPPIPYPFRELYEQTQINRRASQEGALNADLLKTRDITLPGPDTEAQYAFEQEYIGKADELINAYTAGSMPPEQFKFEVERLANQKKNDMGYRMRLASYAKALKADEMLQQETLAGSRPLGVPDNYSYTTAQWDSAKRGIYSGMPTPYKGTFDPNEGWNDLQTVPFKDVFYNEEGVPYQQTGVPESAIAQRADQKARAAAITNDGKQFAQSLRQSYPQLYGDKSDYEILYTVSYTAGKSYADRSIMNMPVSDVGSYNGSGGGRTGNTSDEAGGITQGFTMQTQVMPSPMFSYQDESGKSNTYGDSFGDFGAAVKSNEKRLKDFEHIKMNENGEWINTRTGNLADSSDIQAKASVESDLRIARENRSDIFNAVQSELPHYVGTSVDGSTTVGLVDKISEQNRQRELGVVRDSVKKLLDPWSKIDGASMQSIGASTPQEARDFAKKVKLYADSNKMDIGEAATLLYRKDLYKDTYYLKNPGVIPTGKYKGWKVNDAISNIAVKRAGEVFKTSDSENLVKKRDRVWSMDYMPLNYKNPVAENLIKFIENADINQGGWYDPTGDYSSDEGFKFPDLELDPNKQWKRSVQGITVSPIDNKLYAVVKMVPTETKGNKNIEDESAAKSAMVDISSFGDNVLAQMDFGAGANTVMDFARQVGYQQLYLYGDNGSIVSNGLEMPFRRAANNKEFFVQDIDPSTGKPIGKEQRVMGKFGVAQHYAKSIGMYQEVQKLNKTDFPFAVARTESGTYDPETDNKSDVATEFQFRKSYHEKAVKEKLGMTWDEFVDDPQAPTQYFNSHVLPNYIRYVTDNYSTIQPLAARWSAKLGDEVPMDKQTILYLSHRLGSEGMVRFLQEASKKGPKDIKNIKAKDGAYIYNDLLRFTQNRR